MTNSDDLAVVEIARRLHIPAWTLGLLIKRGDKVAMAFLLGYLRKTTPGMLYGYVEDKKPLLQNVKDSDWELWSSLARLAHLKDISKERIVKEFEEKRPDLLGVIINHPGGDQWLESQIDILRQKLQLSPEVKIDYTRESPPIVDNPTG